MRSSYVQITNSFHEAEQKIGEDKQNRTNDEINWIRASILIFIIVPVQTYLSHLPSSGKHVTSEHES